MILVYSKGLTFNEKINSCCVLKVMANVQCASFGTHATRAIVILIVGSRLKNMIEVPDVNLMHLG